MATPAEVLLKKADHEPESLSPTEQLTLGLAYVETLLDPQAQQLLGNEAAEKIATGLENGIPLIISGLDSIRQDKAMPEQMKLRLGLRVLGHIDFGQLPDGELKHALFGKAWLTVVAGLRSPIRAEIARLTEEWARGNLSLGAAVRLGSKRQELTARQQLDYLAQDLTTLRGVDKKGQRQILIAWAKEVIKDGGREADAAEVIKFFFDRKDDQAAIEVTGFYLQQPSSLEI